MNYKIMVVDDEQMERGALEAIISGYLGEKAQIRQAANGRDAVLMAKEFKPDIALMDIKMPIMNGIEAGKEILGFFPNCYIIMLTGFTYFTYAKESVNIGAADFLVKPVADVAVIEAIDRAVMQVENMEKRRIREEENQKKAMRAERYMESELVSSIAFSNVDEVLIQEQMENLGLSFRYGVGAIAELQSINHEEKVNGTRIIKSCIDKVKTEARICVCEHYNKVYMLILTSESRERDWYKTLIKDLSEMLEMQKLKIKVATGIQVSQLKNIYLSFREARSNLDSGKRINIHHQHGNVMENQISRAEQEQKMVTYLKMGSYDEAMLYLEKMMELFFYEGQEAVMKIYELLVVINRSLPRELETTPVFELFRRMSQETEKELVMGQASAYVEAAIDGLIAQEEGVDSAWEAKMKEYIQIHYMKNITLEDMALHAGFSTYYFSKLFKQRFQLNFVDYLTKVRIQKAKEMLEREGKSVKEVSGLVGYSEPNYFTRVFKKETGIPPSVYQKSAMLAKKC